MADHKIGTREEWQAARAGTDVAGYLTEGLGFSVFILDGGALYQTYSTTGRVIEFLMGYHGVLDRMPKGPTRARCGRPGSTATTSTTATDAGRTGRAGTDDLGALIRC